MFTALLADGAASDTSVITDSLTSMVATVKDVIMASLPVVLPVAAILVAAGVTVKIFKRFARG